MSFYQLIALLSLITFTSCISNRNLVYFPDPTFNSQRPTDIVNELQVYRIQPRDVLSVKVKTLDAESSAYFNLDANVGFQQLNPAGMYLNGYSVDEEGFITLPEVGNIAVAGISILEAQKRIQSALSVYLNNATILVKLVSFKITVLGEVQNPGYYFIYNDQATVLEGLGMAGDLTDFGNRENITLIRQTQSGSQSILLNLRDPALLASEYYYLQPNDVLYIQPLQAKNTRSNLNTFGVLSILFSAVSTAVLILNYTDNN